MDQKILNDRIKSILFGVISLVVTAYIISDSMQQFISFAVYFIVLIVVFESGGFVWKKVKPILPNNVVSVITVPYQVYVGLWRRILPDCVYKLWLRTDVMDEEVYRTFQEKGFISDDLDPKYLMEKETNN